MESSNQISKEALLDLIGELGREVHDLIDDCETSTRETEDGFEYESHEITSYGLSSVSAVLDKIDALGFTEPGVILGTGAMLQVAIQKTFGERK